MHTFLLVGLAWVTSSAALALLLAYVLRLREDRDPR